MASTYLANFKIRLKNWLGHFVSWLGSRPFFYLTLGWFGLQSAWIALSARYPQAYDEDWHFGLIKIYSHHILPFLTHQPAGADSLGPVATDPSYLFRYLMSWPYRLIKLVTSSQTGQVIALRLIDIGLFGLGLVLFHQLLLKLGLSSKLTNLSLFLFIMLPVVPQLAGQINYDDLLLPLTAISLLLALKLSQQLSAHRLAAKDLILLVSVCLLASITKFEFLPIFLAIILWLTYQTFKFNWRAGWTSFKSSFGRLSTGLKLTLVGTFLISAGLFSQRYVLNFVRYQSINPDCAKVLSVQACNHYYVWNFDHAQHQMVLAHTNPPTTNFVFYMGQWLYWMWYRLFFAVSGPQNSYLNWPPLPVPALAGLLIGLGGMIAVAAYARQLFKNKPVNQFAGLICLIYLLALIEKGFSAYKYTAILEIMNPRYLLPILLLLTFLAGQALAIAFKGRGQLKIYLATAACLMFLWGGGVFTFIERSDNTWLWPNQAVIDANNIARAVISHVVISGPRYYYTRIWMFN